MLGTGMTASVVSLAMACASAARAQFVKTAEKEVVQALYASDEAADKRDVAALEHLTADEYIWHTSTGIVQTKAHTIAETVAGGSTWNVRMYDGLKVRIYGDIAIATGTFLIEGTSTTYRQGARLITRIFIRRDGRWQDLGGQATLIPPE
jgi:ketosteroid isomerase-like protein